MFIGNEIKQIVEKRYREMVQNNETSAVLDQKTLGDVMLFIDTPPSDYFMSFEIEGKNVYVGSDGIKAV